ncbi:hypothetical protein PCE1_004747 [Barthelona sp. PCE]
MVTKLTTGSKPSLTRRSSGKGFNKQFVLLLGFFVFVLFMLIMTNKTIIHTEDKTTQFCHCQTADTYAIYVEGQGCTCLPTHTVTHKKNESDTEGDTTHDTGHDTEDEHESGDDTHEETHEHETDTTDDDLSQFCNTNIDTCASHGHRIKALYTKTGYSANDTRNPLVLFVSSEPHHCKGWQQTLSGSGGCYQKTMYRLIEYAAGAGMTIGFTCQRYRGSVMKSPSGAVIAPLSYFSKPYFTIAEREPPVLLKVAQTFDSPLLGWQSHDAHYATQARHLTGAQGTFTNAVRKESTKRFVFMGVSQWHTLEMKKHVSNVDQKKMTYDVLFNVLDRELMTYKPHSERDLKRLFFGSAHSDARKIAERLVIDQLKADKYSLWVTGPSYSFGGHHTNHDNIIYKSPMTESQFTETIATSLGYLYPAIGCEAFGCVFSQANALGIPVLTTNVGAAPEVLGQDTSQVIDSFDNVDLKTIINRWNNNPPSVKADSRFTPIAVVGRLVAIMEGDEWDQQYDIKGPAPDLGCTDPTNTSKCK